MHNLQFLVIFLNIIFFFGCSSTHLVKINPQQGDACIIKNVNVFTGIQGEPTLENVDVYIKGNKIEKISKESLTVGKATIINGAGMTLLPGLIDSHTHLVGGMIVPWKMQQLPTPEYNLEAALYSGITTVIDMGGKSVGEMNAIRERIKEGKIPGPDIYHCGMAFTGAGSHPIPYLEFIKDNIPFILYPFIPKVAIEIRNTDDIQKVKKQLDERPDFTKVFVDRIPENSPILSDELLKEIVAASHRKGVPVFCHIGSNKNLKSLIECGADGAMHDVYTEDIDVFLAKKMAEKDIFVVTTIVAWHNYDLVVNKRSFNHYTKIEYETMHPSRYAALKNPRPDDVTIRDKWRSHDRMHAGYTPLLYPNIMKMKKAGVKILAGTDAPNYMLNLGGSIHTELEHMVKAGMTPGDVLFSATSIPAQVIAKMFKTEFNFGQIKEGFQANLLLVRGDPVNKITDTRNIVEVFIKGKRIERSPGNTGD